jgi:hypothetical protein
MSHWCVTAGARAMFGMAVQLAEKGADVHKWASLEETRVFPVKPLVSLVFVREMVAVFLFGLALLTYVVSSGAGAY